MSKKWWTDYTQEQLMNLINSLIEQHEFTLQYMHANIQGTLDIALDSWSGKDHIPKKVDSVIRQNIKGINDIFVESYSSNYKNPREKLYALALELNTDYLGDIEKELRVFMDIMIQHNVTDQVGQVSYWDKNMWVVESRSWLTDAEIKQVLAHLNKMGFGNLIKIKKIPKG